MTIATFDALQAARAVARRVMWDKIGSAILATPGNAGFFSLWTLASSMLAAGSVPPSGAGEATTKNMAGALWLPEATAGAYFRLASMAVATQSPSAAFFDIAMMLADRLVHTSGLSGTSTSAQAVNTAALTRHTSGEGVQAFLQVYTQLGITTATVAVSYTNQAGVAGRAGTATIVTNSRQVGSLIRVALEGADTGVRSVESVTLSVSTGTAGNFGVTLLKPLTTVGINGLTPSTRYDWMKLGLAKIPADTCLSEVLWVTGTGATPGFVADAELIEDT